MLKTSCTIRVLYVPTYMYSESQRKARYLLVSSFNWAPFTSLPVQELIISDSVLLSYFHAVTFIELLSRP